MEDASAAEPSFSIADWELRIADLLASKGPAATPGAVQFTSHASPFEATTSEPTTDGARGQDGPAGRAAQTEQTHCRGAGRFADRRAATRGQYADSLQERLVSGGAEAPVE